MILSLNTDKYCKHLFLNDWISSWLVSLCLPFHLLYWAEFCKAQIQFPCIYLLFLHTIHLWEWGISSYNLSISFQIHHMISKLKYLITQNSEQFLRSLFDYFLDCFETFIIDNNKFSKFAIIISKIMMSADFIFGNK